jgi:hypothetical protein
LLAFPRRWLGGGEGGIRTHEGCYPLLVFETSSFGRSDTSPSGDAAAGR